MPTGSRKTDALLAHKVLTIAPSLQIHNQIALSWGLSSQNSRPEEGEADKCFFLQAGHLFAAG